MSKIIPIQVEYGIMALDNPSNYTVKTQYCYACYTLIPVHVATNGARHKLMFVQYRTIAIEMQSALKRLH